mmetsp:Transcript_69927/g.193377  ORF Transcript_69927/g.193377 Transcript_69927/m.193377 type:complete len:422 (-) Transcript_69927:198-1463(-)
MAPACPCRNEPPENFPTAPGKDREGTVESADLDIRDDHAADGAVKAWRAAANDTCSEGDETTNYLSGPPTMLGEGHEDSGGSGESTPPSKEASEADLMEDFIDFATYLELEKANGPLDLSSKSKGTVAGAENSPPMAHEEGARGEEQDLLGTPTARPTKDERTAESALRTLGLVVKPNQKTPKTSTPSPAAGNTTVMIRNLPQQLTQRELADTINQSGFFGHYNFLYMPALLASRRTKGYAFVNFTTEAAAQAFASQWNKTRRFGAGSNVLNVSFARIQGCDANMARWFSPRMCRIKNPNYRPLHLPTAPTASLALLPVWEAGMTAYACAMGTFAYDPTVMEGVGSPGTQGVGTDIVGAQCIIHGLVACPEYNGAQCIVESYDTSMERYVVQVQTACGEWAKAKVRRENLTVLAPAARATV